ncbi:hypothetical protein QBC37DRAFT_296987 [Rhypophila decipiens]|uniref:Uncharacterized protein n=1 Tax=Rhypophila decipiens TaxID=261697 RepID=A0AAN6XZ23_9PEZI|nr:hypothetical protein QBC37DRAFT_296987 [Rhypophila decipiens]
MYPGIILGLRQTEGKGDDDDYKIAAHPTCPGPGAHLLQVREVAMMVLMDRLTDKPNWTEKIHNPEILAKWRKEAMTSDFEQDLGVKNPTERTRLISQKAFDFCIAELKCKADFFKESGLIYTLDTYDRDSYGYDTDHHIIKSDVLVKQDLHQQLKDAFDKLMADQATSPDWHPRTNDMVWDIVHPSMYPFVYNRTHFIHDEVVGIEDAIDKWSGKGTVPTQNKTRQPRNGGNPYTLIPDNCWSDTYQWLPSNLAIQDDGTVKFTSYINNLHPNKYREVYSVIEKLIDAAMPAWNHALHGFISLKHSSAMPDGEEEENGQAERFDLPPEIFEDTDDAGIWEDFNPELYEAKKDEVDIDENDIDETIENLHWEDNIEDQDEETVAKWREEAIRHFKWKEMRDPVLPEPLDFSPVRYQTWENIRNKYKEKGLQVYVKMASIELTPEKPKFPQGGWHIEGQLNEQIVATALYYVDSENVTTSSLSFRQRCESEQESLERRVGQSLYDYYEKIYDTQLSRGNGQAVQHFGDVVTQQGRLLAFPNVYQHHVSGFELEDKTKPGHRRFIALWLVNPDIRVISTANVPPQQFDWWFEAVANGGGKGQVPLDVMQLVLDKKSGGVVAGEDAAVVDKLTAGNKVANRLPPEIMDMVRKDAELDGLMTLEEAKEHRLKLMAERSVFDTKTATQFRSFGFCEH